MHDLEPIRDFRRRTFPPVSSSPVIDPAKLINSSDINTNNVGSYTGLYWYMVCNNIIHHRIIATDSLRTPDTSKPKPTARVCTAPTRCTSVAAEPQAPPLTLRSSRTSISRDTLLLLGEVMLRVLLLELLPRLNGLFTGEVYWYFIKRDRHLT